MVFVDGQQHHHIGTPDVAGFRIDSQQQDIGDAVFAALNRDVRKAVVRP